MPLALYFAFPCTRSPAAGGAPSYLRQARCTSCNAAGVRCCAPTQAATFDLWYACAVAACSSKQTWTCTQNYIVAARHRGDHAARGHAISESEPEIDAQGQYGHPVHSPAPTSRSKHPHIFSQHCRTPGCRLRPPSREILHLRKEGSQNDFTMFPRSCGTSGSHKKPAMQCQHAQKKLLGSLRLARRTNHEGPCSMPSRAGAPSSIPTHCQRDQEREAHARSSRRDAEAASSAETGVKTHPPAQHSSNDTTACCELLLCTLLGRISHLRLATRWRFLPLS